MQFRLRVDLAGLPDIPRLKPIPRKTISKLNLPRFHREQKSDFSLMLPILHSVIGQQLRICDLKPTIASRTAMLAVKFASGTECANDAPGFRASSTLPGLARDCLCCDA